MSASTSHFSLRGQIKDPPRSSALGAVVLVLVLIGAGLIETLPGRSWGVWIFCATVMLFPMAIASRSLYAVHVNIFILYFYILDNFPHFGNYPFNNLTLLALYAYTVILVRPLRESVGWLRAGKMTRGIWISVLIVIALSALALIAWAHHFSRDLSRYTALLPKMPLSPLIFCAIGTCAFNSALEEITWRGVMMEALDSAFGPGYVSLILQALSFGLAHYANGFPNGVLGGAMTFAFAILLGILRRKSRGMLACWITHFAADSVIFGMILWYVHHAGK